MTFAVAWANVLAFLQWIFKGGVTAFQTAWTTSRKATEIAIVGAVIFLALVYFGVFSKPDINPDLTKEVAALSKQVAGIQKTMATKDDISFIEDQMKPAPKATAPQKLITGSNPEKFRKRWAQPD